MHAIASSVNLSLFLYLSNFISIRFLIILSGPLGLYVIDVFLRLTDVAAKPAPSGVVFKAIGQEVVKYDGLRCEVRAAVFS